VTTVIAMVSISKASQQRHREFKSLGATLVQFQKYDPQFGPATAIRRAAGKPHL